jgi:hypothetical protein
MTQEQADLMLYLLRNILATLEAIQSAVEKG